MQSRSLAASLTGAAMVFAFTMTASAQGEPPGTPGGWAVVNADGSLGASSNVKGVRHVGAGVYKVKFNQPVRKCAANATVGGSAKTLLPGYIVVHRHDNVVGVHTFAAVTLLPADFKFDLALTCPAS